MTITSPRESAKIFQFPLRGRFAADADDRQPVLSPRYAKAVCGSSWYHEEAIQEERARQN